MNDKNGQTFDKGFVQDALLHIALALQSCNNCIATDDIVEQPDETHWRIDNTKALELISCLESALGIERELIVSVPAAPSRLNTCP